MLLEPIPPDTWFLSVGKSSKPAHCSFASLLKFSPTARMEVNLGRKSLKSRLLAYYTVVVPTKVHDLDSKFGDIYDKYGGSIEAEAKLQKKLRKLYGSEVLLNIVTGDEPKKRKVPLIAPSIKGESSKRRPPSSPSVADDDLLLVASTGVTCFTSPSFDPYAALHSEGLPTTGDLVLDNVDRCRYLLPQEDEYFIPLSKKPSASAATSKQTRPKEAPPFIALAESLKSSPFSTLHKAMTLRRRVKVTVRYVNCIRGHVVGSVEGFDRHFNILLSSATETYSTRLVDFGGLSQAQAEESRRLNGFGKGLKTRSIKQMMIRGDMLVSVQLL